MTFEFRPAIREQVGLLIGLAGASGSGKTFSAMRLASGIVGGKRFAVIDTEARRAKHYSDQFAFDHGDLKPPFSPAAYMEAIKAADEAGYPAIVIDSMSHEHSGEGGVLDMHEAEMQRMAGDDWKKREAVKMAAWIKPKSAHKRLVQHLLQVRAHLIFCLRAEEKVEMVRGDDNKMKIIPKGYQPTCAKDFMFEMTCSFLLLPTAPGIPQPIKLQEQHRPAFPAGKPIDETCGVALARWASGGSVKQTTPVPTSAVAQSDRAHQAAMPGATGEVHDEGPNGDKAASIRWIAANGREVPFKTPDEMADMIGKQIAGATPDQARAARARNAAIMADIGGDAMVRLSKALAERESADAKQGAAA